jgi:hypothetical protein
VGWLLSGDCCFVSPRRQNLSIFLRQIQQSQFWAAKLIPAFLLLTNAKDTAAKQKVVYRRAVKFWVQQEIQ